MSNYYPNHTLKYLRQSGSDWVSTFRKTLLKYNKKATGFTSASIRYESTIKSSMVTNTIYANRSLIYINQGRPQGAKMPPSIFSRKGKPLNLWFGARRIPRNRSTDYLVRRAIAKRGIEPVPVIEESLEQIQEISKKGLVKVVKLDLLEMGYVFFSKEL
jgi:hypothetical protein